MSLKSCFKALEFVFSLKSMETVYLFSCYQGIITIILQVLNSLITTKSKSKVKNIKYEEDYFWAYLQEFDPTLEKPDILYILDVFPPKRKRTLLTNLFTSQKLTPKSTPSHSNTRGNVAVNTNLFKMNYSCENIQMSLETVWLDLVGSLKLTSKDSKIHLFHRDVPTFTNIYKLLQPLSQSILHTYFTYLIINY